jgi:hypothetical protein
VTVVVSRITAVCASASPLKDAPASSTIAVQNYPVEERQTPKGCLARDLPEDVTGLAPPLRLTMAPLPKVSVCAIWKMNTAFALPWQLRLTVHLYHYRGPPFVEAGSENHPADISGPKLGSIGVYPFSGVGVRGLHVANGCNHLIWSGSRVVGCMHPSGHRRGCRKCSRGIKVQAKSGQASARDWTHSDIPGD